MSTRKRPAPTRRTGGRVTPKGGPSARGDATSRAPEASTRYTPPNPRAHATSPRWLPVLMLGLIALGVLVIFLHYVDLFLPGGSSNWWLLVGLGFILSGIVAATQYR
jgi:hypothetical protein